MSERIGGWMQTVSGKRYWPVDPRAEEVDIGDIAHALGMMCRFGGHTRRFYSVAEHCVLVSGLVSQKNALCGLLHDATEAYCVDVPRPLKRSLPEYKAAEIKNWLVIAERFGLPSQMPVEVKHADEAILHVEQAALMPTDDGRGWCVEDTGHIDTSRVVIRCWSPEVARQNFLNAFTYYHKG